LAEDNRERTLRYLNDAYASEVGALKAMESVIAEATDPDLKAAVSSHLTETQGHADLLAARIQALGGDKSEPKAMVNQFIALASHAVNAFHDADDKQTQDLIKSVSLEGFEIATYTALKAFATEVGDSGTADVAQSILTEEKSAYDKLLALVPKVATHAVVRVAVTA
jgi:ferritin-like metal-binding protein YciE